MGFPIRFPSLDNSFVDRKEFYYKYYWTISYLLQNVTTVKPAPAPLKLLKVEQNCSLQYLPKNARTIRDGNVSFLISFRSDCMIAILLLFSKTRISTQSFTKQIKTIIGWTLRSKNKKDERNDRSPKLIWTSFNFLTTSPLTFVRSRLIGFPAEGK